MKNLRSISEYSCKECGKRFTSEKSYEKHKKKIQDKQKEYKIEMQEALMGKTTFKYIFLFGYRLKAEWLRRRPVINYFALSHCLPWADL